MYLGSIVGCVQLVERLQIADIDFLHARMAKQFNLHSKYVKSDLAPTKRGHIGSQNIQGDE